MHPVDKEWKRALNNEAILKSMEKTDADTVFMYVNKRKSSDLKYMYMCVCIFRRLLHGGDESYKLPMT